MVKLEFVINPDGTVGEIKVNTASSADIEQIAIDTAKKWTFYSARLLDVPIAFIVQADLTFGDKPNVTFAPLRRMHSSLGPD